MRPNYTGEEKLFHAETTQSRKMGWYRTAHNGYIHHMDENVRAVAVDRVGRLRITALQPTLQKFLGNKRELPSVRAASAFALTLLGDPASFGDLLRASHERGFIG